MKDDSKVWMMFVCLSTVLSYSQQARFSKHQEPCEALFRGATCECCARKSNLSHDIFQTFSHLTFLRRVGAEITEIFVFDLFTCFHVRTTWKCLQIWNTLNKLLHFLFIQVVSFHKRAFFSNYFIWRIRYEKIACFAF